MTTTAIRKQVDEYLPLLSTQQQTLILEMIKEFLNVDVDAKSVTRMQYNNAINDAVTRIDLGDYVSNDDAIKELSKW